MFSDDINALLEPVSAEAPCGVDLENSAIAELDRLAQGKPEQQIGSTVVPAEQPDWKQVRHAALEVLARSKDLRAASQLTKAWLWTDGWTGFARGLALLAGLIVRYWDGLYPRLDPEDDHDPTMRINILMSLSDPVVLNALRATPLLTSRTMGRFSVKDIEAAAGDGAPFESSGSASTTMASLSAAAMDCDLDVLQQSASAVRGCASGLVHLETALGAHVEVARLPSFAKVAALARKADEFLGSVIARRVPAGQSGHAEGPATASGSGRAATAWTGGIKSREDVSRAIDAICGYYEEHEPSSPIPIFMARCKRLVMMGFVDIVRELLPDALSQVDVLRGHVENQ